MGEKLNKRQEPQQSGFTAPEGTSRKATRLFESLMSNGPWWLTFLTVW